MLSLFLSGNTDPDLQMTVKIQWNNYESQIYDIIAMKKQEREISRESQAIES